MTPIEQVRAKVAEVVEKARTMYGVDLSVVRIGFDLKGRVAGWAQWKRHNGVLTYSCRFNADMLLRNDPDTLRDMVEDTVPHELAHIVCYLRPELGRNHDSGWQRVCIALGGTGGRTHDMEVVYGKGTTYEYTTDRGHKVRLSDRHHAHIQAGGTLNFRRGKGMVANGYAYTIVGQNGRTLANPIVKQPVATREVPVQTLLPTLRPVLPPVAPRILPPAPPVQRPVPVQAAPGESKAATSRRIMLAGYRAGHSYETIIAAMIAANGYDRQLARGTFKANGPKVGIPASFYA
jgi:predicted SprT family Zn-dependent metalloprotease